jgi:DNA (cytosine-5)-methyltransferase 1
LILSLFPGIGLLDLAFEMEGFCVVRGPDPLWGGNIRIFHPSAGVFAGVLGGPPCQEFSPLRYLLATQGRRPKYGNLIPEFERVVREVQPEWFLMENVPEAPVPYVAGYISKDCLMNNRWVGGVQHRKRRFTFGTRNGSPLVFDGSLVIFESGEWTFTALAHDPAPGQRHPSSVIRSGVNKLPQVKGRKPAAVLAGHGPLKYGAVTSSDGGASVRMARYTLTEMCVLQGLPETFCADMPFTMEGKRSVIGNGVPIPLGRAVARAVKQALYAGEGGGSGPGPPT